MIINHEIYKPLYQNTDKPIILITGGRASGKSFSVSTFIERLTFELKKYINDNGEVEKIVHNILYCRYTMVSANISVIPEFMEKIDIDGTTKYFTRTKSDVTNIMTGSRIMFRGIKTSSGNQTAKLKSIHGITTFVCDEAEEWSNEQEFDTIALSIRQKGIQNRIIIIMNPTDSNHFIYQKYIKDTHIDVEYDGVPVQISTHPDVLHIHTTYLDNIEHLSDTFLKEVQTMKETNPDKYAHVVMGKWSDVAEGAIFKKWSVIKEMPSYKELRWRGRGLDFGYTCFSGDTLITTKRGLVEIKDIVEGDMVLTRHGYRRVLKRLYNGKKTIYKKKLVIGEREIIMCATKEHNFNANGKWKKYEQLTKGDNLYVLSNLTESDTSAIQVVNTKTTSTRSGKTKMGIIASYYTMQFGSFITEQYQKAKLYTTLTRTRLTTTFLTLWLSLHTNITKCIERIFSKRYEKVENWGNMGLVKKIGQLEEALYWQILKRKNDIAKRVEESLSQQTLIKGFVLNNATINGNTKQKKILQRLFANGVEKSFLETNISSQNAALTSAHISNQTVKEIVDLGEQYNEDVYDLTIEGVHEYFANGVLVHNCDPTACVYCGIDRYNNLYIDEQFYETGLLPSEIIRKLKSSHNAADTFVYADCADPQLIDEIFLGGIMIYGSNKSGGLSIVAGLEKMKDFNHIYITERSYNVQNEFRNYTWDKDKNGNFINQPIDAYNHSVDAARYYIMGRVLGLIVKPKKNVNNIANAVVF